MVQYRSHPSSLATLRSSRSDYWKVWSPAHFEDDRIPSKELKLQIDARSGGGRQYTSGTSRSRLRILAYRAQRRLRCYDGDPKNLLRIFCRQRGLPIALQKAHKLELIKALETADELATFDRFLDLPAELRLLVYGFHFDDFEMRANCTDKILSHRELTYPATPAIAQVCSLIRRESLPCFYQTTSFVFIALTRPKKLNVPPKPRASAGVRFLKTLPAETIAMIRHITFRGYFSSAIHGTVGEKTEMTIDMGIGKINPKVVAYQRPKKGHGRVRPGKAKIERKLERRAHRFVRSMTGRPNDQRLLKSDFKAISTLYKQYGGKVYRKS
ncbi:uncharacterized protein RCC_06470 [Ramularia collo-cygni]|uniref:Uncharacterized protein n=1 Tax=Ramularia collo-cygni TaxID=112498 RepID=A0A2D3UT43_9PEZI|nr:uncharacterized protein RCC_06470 [Ramularia collo-cygni]CZT20612.1 uncharacterized protein RCC_06470 [Ramularia collo-cygni]